MAHVAITGAAGNVGRVVTEAFTDHETTLFTESEEAGMDSVVLDVTDREAFRGALAERDVDVLIHLAANPNSGTERRKTGGPLFTANGNLVLDCDFGEMDDIEGLARELASIPTSQEHGLFVGLVDDIYVGTDDGVETIEF